MSLIYEALQKAKQEKDVARALDEGRPIDPDMVRPLPQPRERNGNGGDWRHRGGQPPHREDNQSVSRATRILLPAMIIGTLLCLSIAMAVFAFYLVSVQRAAMNTINHPSPQTAPPQVTVVTVTPVPAAAPTPLAAPLPPTPTPQPLPVNGAAQGSVPPAQIAVPQSTPLMAPPSGTPVPHVSLGAILAAGGTGTGMCLLNGDVYSEGQTKNGITLRQVFTDSVVIQQGNNDPITLRAK